MLRIFTAIYVVALIALLAVNHWFWQDWAITIGSWQTQDVHAILIGVIIAAPILFVAITGVRNLARRIPPIRLIFVSLIPAYALATLLWGALVATGEMLQLPELTNDLSTISLIVLLGGFIAEVVFFLAGRKPDRFHVVRRFGWILVELAALEIVLAAVSRIVIATRTPIPNPIFAGPHPGGGLLAGFNVLISVIGPMLIFALKRPRYDAERGLCRRCGYDLRASVDRCPECGTPIPAQISAATSAGIG